MVGLPTPDPLDTAAPGRWCVRRSSFLPGLATALLALAACGDPAPVAKPPEDAGNPERVRFEDLVLEGGSPGSYLPKYLPKARGDEPKGSPANSANRALDAPIDARTDRGETVMVVARNGEQVRWWWAGEEVAKAALGDAVRQTMSASDVEVRVALDVRGAVFVDVSSAMGELTRFGIEDVRIIDEEPAEDEATMEALAPVLIRGSELGDAAQLIDMMRPRSDGLRIGEPLPADASVAASHADKPLLVVAGGEVGPRYWWRGAPLAARELEHAIEAWAAGRNPAPEVAISLRGVSPRVAREAFEVLVAAHCRFIDLVK